MDPGEIQREIETFCNRMSEHVDSIRVFVTKPENGDTAFHSYGTGNWFAQRGSCEQWLKSNEQQDLAQLIAHSDP